MSGGRGKKTLNKTGFFRYCYRKENRQSLCLLLIVSLLYLIVRIAVISDFGLFCDEAFYLHWASRMNAHPSSWFLSLEVGKYPVFIWLLRLAMLFISDPLIAGRLVSIFFGLFAMLGLFSLGLIFFNYRTGIIAALLYIVFPLAFVHDRMTLFETPLNAFMIWGLVLLLWIFRERKFDHNAIDALAVMCVGAFCFKMTGYYLAVFAPVAFLLYAPHVKKKNVLPAIVLLAMTPIIVYSIFSFPSRMAHLDQNVFMEFNLKLLLPHSSSGFPAVQWKNNFLTIFDYLVKYWGAPAFFLAVWGWINLVYIHRWRDGWFLLLWTLGPVLFFIFFGRIIFYR